MKFIILLLLMLCTQKTIWGQDDFSSFKSDSIIEGKDILRYKILYPDHFDANKEYPLFFFLHGAGERGSDNTSQLKYVVPFMQSIEKQYPAIIIAPQCPDSIYWAKVKLLSGQLTSKHEFIFYPESTPNAPMRLLLSLTKKWQSEKFIDKNKVYIGGLSMGGMGTYELLIRRPIPFAAAFVICGGTNVINLKQKIGKTPIWIFHGTDDPIVPVEYGRQIANMLKMEKKEVKYTEYANTGHDSWLKALQEKELIPWLFLHKR